MRALLSSLLLLALCAGCKSNAPVADSGALLAQVKQRFHERDQKLASYQVRGQVNEADQEARYTFRFRAPSRMRGELTAPRPRTVSFDGKLLSDLDPAQKVLTRIDVSGSKESAALLLNQVFSSFISEGYRTPLLMSAGVSAEMATHEKAREAVKVSQTAKGPDGDVTVAYLMRWPSMDFLGKTVTSTGGVVRVQVDEEHCEEKFGLCVPKALSQWNGDTRTATTVMSDIAINSALPADDFSLALPEGFTEQRKVVK